jgi:hypothetical protein
VSPRPAGCFEAPPTHPFHLLTLTGLTVWHGQLEAEQAAQHESLGKQTEAAAILGEQLKKDSAKHAAEKLGLERQLAAAEATVTELSQAVRASASQKEAAHTTLLGEARAEVREGGREREADESEGGRERGKQMSQKEGEREREAYESEGGRERGTGREGDR